jgi:heme/copper-type cytochrome/quinol oxidase subunit 2
MDETQDPDNTREIIEVNPMVHLIAPVAAIVGTMIVRKVVSSAYERATGRPAPEARDPQTSMARALVWTVVIATTAAVAEVVIYRVVNSIGEKEIEV